MGPTPAAAAPPDSRTVYEVRDVGGPGAPSSQAYGISSSGLVTGYSSDAEGVNRAFVWDSRTGTTTLFPDGEFLSTVGMDVNDRGQVVGYGELPPGGDLPFGGSRTFVWDLRTGTTTLLGTLGGDSAYGEAINDRGQVTGMAYTVDRDYHAFVWDPVTGVMQDLGAPGDADWWSSGSGINDRGQVAGTASTWNGQQSRAFLWDPRTGVTTDLGTLPGMTEATAWDINARGDVVGSAWGADGGSAFLWSARAGTMTALPGGCDPLALNDRGDVAGIAVAAGVLTACVRNAATGVVTLLPHLTAGAESVAWDISRSGHVAGWSGAGPTAVVWTPARRRS
ncbi:hypothetical protein Q760_15995 [Cellulomonas cellasea DSM 20118]|uniref:Uncharacterized protein n=1 Tax=Cellulomonas cellasea DSM 20118 TaxID=1408250 RepID=A0A0A0B9T4_9CELL|nr:hypothetical protein Q760_15995 [Cellulomonas cellasea DSM 20118]